MELIVDVERHTENMKREVRTGVLVRAKMDDRFINADIADLDKASLLTWLKSRGGDNRWAEDTVGILLGHGHLHEHQQ